MADDQAAVADRSYTQARSSLSPAKSFAWIPATSAYLEHQLSEVGQKARFLLTYYSFCYSLYSIGIILVGTLLYWLIDPSGLGFLDALFLATSTVTMAGLTPIDFTQTRTSMQVVAWLLIVLASPMLLTTVPPALRAYCSRPRLHRRISRHGTAFFGVSTSEVDEKMALKVIIKYVLIYWLVVQLVGAASVWVGFKLAGVEAGVWDALFITTSSFHNCGLLNVELPLKEGFGAVLVLIALIAVVLLGNTLFPVALRVIIAWRKRCERNEQKRTVLSLLLRYPRTCYTHLFPDYATRWLAVVTPLLIFLQIVTMGLADFWAEPKWDNDRRHPVSMAGMTWGQRVLATIFLAGTARTGGLSVMQMGLLSPTSAFVLSLCMYISVCPLVVVMRSTVQEQQNTKLEYHMEDEPMRVANSKVVKEQAKVFMGHDVTVLLVLLFVIMLTEEYSGLFNMVYGEFLKIVFEFCSAYGTVGLSLTNSPISRSGSWNPVAKLALMVVMFMGRLRGLPESFDPTVKFGMEESDDEAEVDRADTMGSEATMEETMTNSFQTEGRGPSSSAL